MGSVGRLAPAVRPHSSATSRSGALMIVKPPRCSLPSTNGPSVMSASPSLTRTTVAVLGGCSPPANTQLPVAFSSRLITSISRHDLRQHFGRRRIAVGLIDAEEVQLHGVVSLGWLVSQCSVAMITPVVVGTLLDERELRHVAVVGEQAPARSEHQRVDEQHDLSIRLRRIERLHEHSAAEHGEVAAVALP